MAAGRQSEFVAAHTGAVSPKFAAEIGGPNRRSFDYVWRKERAKLRSG
jgi:hypothetical protein